MLNFVLYGFLWALSFLAFFLLLPSRPRYFLTVLAIFKNEEMTLETWLRHYVEQGVDHIVLVDNNSTDSSARQLEPWIERGLVSYHFAPEKHKQMAHIQSAIAGERLKQRTEWLVVCDIDEFFFGTRSSLASTLRQYHTQYDVVYSHWLIFGFNHHVQHPIDVRIANTLRRAGLDECKKYIIRPAKVDMTKLRVHIAEYPTRMAHRVFVEDDLIHLNHYRLQSFNYYNKSKMTRGDVLEAGLDSLRSWDYFNSWNANTTFQDELLKNIAIGGYK